MDVRGFEPSGDSASPSSNLKRLSFKASSALDDGNNDSTKRDGYRSICQVDQSNNNIVLNDGKNDILHKGNSNSNNQIPLNDHDDPNIHEPSVRLKRCKHGKIIIKDTSKRKPIQGVTSNENTSEFQSNLRSSEINYGNHSKNLSETKNADNDSPHGQYLSNKDIKSKVEPRSSLTENKRSTCAHIEGHSTKVKQKLSDKRSPSPNRRTSRKRQSSRARSRSRSLSRGRSRSPSRISRSRDYSRSRSRSPHDRRSRASSRARRKKQRRLRRLRDRNSSNNRNSRLSRSPLSPRRRRSPSRSLSPRRDTKRKRDYTSSLNHEQRSHDGFRSRSSPHGYTSRRRDCSYGRQHSPYNDRRSHDEASKSSDDLDPIDSRYSDNNDTLQVASSSLGELLTATQQQQQLQEQQRHPKSSLHSEDQLKGVPNKGSQSGTSSPHNITPSAQSASTPPNNSTSSEVYDPAEPIIPLSPGDSPPLSPSIESIYQDDSPKPNQGHSPTLGAKDNDIKKPCEDDVIPSSAVQLNQHEKYLQKLNRQERVIEEVKIALKPHYSNRTIDKDQYKDVLRRAVPKICHNKNGEINPIKIKSLVDAYVKKLKHRRY